MNNEDSQRFHLNYKGHFYQQSVVKEYHEGGAHFKASDLFMKLIELQKDQHHINNPSSSTKEEEIEINSKVLHKSKNVLIMKKGKIIIDSLSIIQQNDNTNNHISKNKDINEPSVHRHHRNILSYCQNNPIFRYILTEAENGSQLVSIKAVCKRRNQSISHDIINMKNHIKLKQKQQTRNNFPIKEQKLPMNSLTIRKKRLPKIIKLPQLQSIN